MMFLILGASVLVLAAIRNNKKLHSALAKHHKQNRFLPQAVSLLIVSAQVSELIKVVEHVTIVNVAAAIFLLAILVATKSGTEGELH